MWFLFHYKTLEKCTSWTFSMFFSLMRLSLLMSISLLTQLHFFIIFFFSLSNFHIYNDKSLFNCVSYVVWIFIRFICTNSTYFYYIWSIFCFRRKPLRYISFPFNAFDFLFKISLKKAKINEILIPWMHTRVFLDSVYVSCSVEGWQKFLQ